MRRLSFNIAANAYGQIVTIGVQLILVPAFLHAWSLEYYGKWLILSALPAYLTLADGGLTTVATNRILMNIGSGNRRAAEELFGSTLSFVISIVGLSIAFLFASWCFKRSFASNAAEATFVVALLALHVVLCFVTNLIETTLKAIDRVPVAIVSTNTIRLAEGLAVVALLSSGTDHLGVALVYVCMRTALTAIYAGAVWSAARHQFEWRFNWSIAPLRPLAKPAAYFCLIPIAAALSIQGVTLVIGALFGGATVALLNTYRTLARAPVQLASIVSHSYWPEFSRQYGVGGTTSLRRLYQQGLRRTISIGTLSVGLVALFGAQILSLWTGGQVEIQTELWAAVLLTSWISIVWHLPRVILIAVNAHESSAKLNAAISLLLVLAMYLVGYFTQSTDSTIWILPLFEGLMAGTTIALVMKFFTKPPAL